MTVQVTYTQARSRLAALLKQVDADRETIIIQRRGGEDVALISAAELRGLLETAHLLRSPKNTERLLAALGSARSGAVEPMTLDELRREVGLD